MTTPGLSTAEPGVVMRGIWTLWREKSDPEPLRPISPQVRNLEPRRACERLKRRLIVLVGRFRPDRLSLVERDLLTANAHVLRNARLEVHLDPARSFVEERDVPEGRDVEVGVEIAIEPREQVEIELRRYT